LTLSDIRSVGPITHSEVIYETRHTGEGTFFEGCTTSGTPSDAIDDAVQANIVAAGYGR
jgi:hypothetical protein